MKKFLAIMTAAAMLSCGTCALADAATDTSAQTEASTAWADGLSPAKPFEDVDEVDLTQTVGYMLVNPEPESVLPCGINSLLIYLPRTDFSYAQGDLTVYNSDGTVYTTCDMSTVLVISLSEDELEYFGWGDGIQLQFILKDALAPDGEYYVVIPEGALYFDGLTQPSNVLDGEHEWSFSTHGYGTANFKSSSDAPAGYTYVGDTEEGDIVLGGEAVRAEIVNDTPDTVSVTGATEFTENGHYSVAFNADGAASYDINFYDADGEKLIGLVNPATIVDNIAGIPNPMVSYGSLDDVNNELGITMKLPEGAQDAQYYVIGGQTAQVDFVLDGGAYTLRMQQSGELTDISGMYYASPEVETVNGTDVKLSGEGQGWAVWYDAQAGVSCSVSMRENATADAIANIVALLG